MTQATVNGNTYSDDGTSARDMLNGGHRQWFLPMVGDVVTVAGQAQSNATQTGIDAANAANSAAATRGTSTTSTLIGAGAKTLTTQANKQFSVGSFVTISRTSAPATLMHGVVTAYNTGTGSITVSVGVVAGSGTFTDWTLALSGAAGATGATGNGSVAYLARTSAYTLLTTDRGSLIDCTSGTFTLAFQAAATLGANWDTTIRNSGTGLITLDPNAAELIDGVATITVAPGTLLRAQCDGTQIRSYGRNSLQQQRIFSAVAALVDPVSSSEEVLNSSVDTLLQSNHIVQNGALFVVSGAGTGASVQTSPDGITWTLRALPSSTTWVVSTDGSGFMAIDRGNLTTVTAYSAAGTSWAGATALPGAPALLLTAFVGISSGRYILRGNASTTTIYLTTNNGTSWTTETAPVASMNLIFSMSGLFFGRVSGASYYTSTTGATGSWTTRTLPATCNSVSQDYDGSMLAYSGTSNCNVYRSTDGVAWTDLGFVQQLNGAIVSINGVYLQGQSQVSFTRHKSMWAARGLFSNHNLTAGLQRARLGDIHFHINTGNVNGLLIDATAANAKSAFFA